MMQPRDEYSGIEIGQGRVLSEWIDVNGHMNVAYYALAFDLAIDSLWGEFGINDKHLEQSRGSTFAAEVHISYRRELKEDDPYVVTTQLLAFSAKGLHQFQFMYHAEEHFLAATAEWINLHVNLDTRRVTPWPDEILDRIRAFTVQQGDIVRAPEVGKIMKLNNPLFRTDGVAR